MNTVSEKEVLDALRVIIDPDLHKDIVTLGFVKNLNISGDTVSFSIELTTPACPVKAEFQKQAEQAVRSLPGVKTVNIEMTSSKRTQAGLHPGQSALKDVRSVIAVSSCKGGVGKSTIAAHLAQELARRGFKTGLVDADIYGPSIPTLFNLKNVTIYSNARKQLIPIEKNGLKIMSFGFLLGDAPAVIRGPIVTQYVQQIIHNTDWGELDYLFVDMPPGTGDIQLTITQTVQLDGAVIVTTPQTLSLIDVARGILMFEKVNVPILGLMENMSYFQCDDCGKKHYPFGGTASQSLQDRFGIELLQEFPVLPGMAAPIDKPLVLDYVSQAVDKVMMSLGKSSVIQKQVPAIQFDRDKISLKWEDGNTLTVSNRDLRLSCQCALCVNEMTGEKILKEENVLDTIAAVSVTPLGNYAIGVTWNDKHASGIYPYKAIKELSMPSANTM